MRRPFVALVSALAVIVTPFAFTPAAQSDGFLDLELSNVSGEPNKLAVTWVAANNYRYKVVVAASRVDGAPTKEYTESPAPAGTRMRLVVPHAPGVTPASGAYTFVRIFAYRDGGRTNTRWDWQVPTASTPPSDAGGVKVATFNIRTWGADRGQKAATSWTHRRGRVIKQMVNSGAGVFLLQEASGSPKLRVARKRWQYQDLAARMPDRYVLARRSTYTYRGRTNGAQGNRIIYDASRYAKRDAGYFRMPGSSVRANRWVPWVLLRTRKTGAEFYAMSMHFKSGDDRPGSTTYFRARQKQAARMVSNAKKLAAHGRTVFVGGDFNSTSNSLPYNGVHRAFIDAGFYDGFATTNRTDGAYPTTNAFRFPVRQQPYRRDYVMALHPTARGDVTPDYYMSGSYSYRNHMYQSRSLLASDHFMQSSTMPVKAGPY